MKKLRLFALTTILATVVSLFAGCARMLTLGAIVAKAISAGLIKAENGQVEILDPTIDTEPTAPTQDSFSDGDISIPIEPIEPTEPTESDGVLLFLDNGFGYDYAISLNEGSFSPYIGTVPAELVTFTSSNESVCTVDNYGVITPVGIGRAIISASYKDQYIQARINVFDNSASVDGVLLFWEKGDGYGYDYTIPLNEGSFSLYTGTVPAELVTFTSSDESVCTVDNYGVITLVSEGRVFISASYKDQYIEAIIRVVS